MKKKSSKKFEILFIIWPLIARKSDMKAIEKSKIAIKDTNLYNQNLYWILGKYYLM